MIRKKPIIEKMYLTQWCGENSASNFHVKLPTTKTSFNANLSIKSRPDQKELWQKSDKFREWYYEKPRKNSKGIRIPKEICKLDTVRT